MRLSVEEYTLLKKASLEGLQQVWFDDKMISIPHVSLIEERIEVISNMPDLPEMSEEELERGRKKLSEMRKKLKEKFSIN